VFRFFIGLILIATILMLISVLKFGRFVGYVVSDSGKEITTEFLVRSILILNILFMIAFVVHQRRKFRKHMAPKERRAVIELDNIRG